MEYQIGELLRQKNLKVVVAESCTGGLIGHRITNVPGSSEYYLGSVTAYAYEAKERLLGVNHETLLKYGAVSREIALEMAIGVRNVLAGDYPLEQLVGLSVTGIAGPGGGMPGKPVGLTWMGLSAAGGSDAWQYIWKGSREEIKAQSADQVLQILLYYLCGLSGKPNGLKEINPEFPLRQP